MTPDSAVLAPDHAVRDYVRDHADSFRDDLLEWLRIPSISAVPAHREDVRASAQWLAAKLTVTGFPTVELWETSAPDGSPGHPAVYAEWPAADVSAPTVLVYGHHDVQPVDPLELWETGPFEPLLRGDELVARGASDDKGQVLFHTLGLRALFAATGATAPPVHLKVLVEGEEEIGSPNFRALLQEQRDRLACDAVVVSDTGIFDGSTPSMCTAMRGLVYCQVDLHGPQADLHSGSFGGAVPNPLNVLAGLLAGLHDDRGRVTLPGFYDRVVGLNDRERELFARLPFDEAEFLANAGSTATAGEAGFTTLERIWARPTCDVNGVWGGHIGPGPKTIIPTDAHAKVSFRLVADQDPDEVAAAMRAYVDDVVPAGVESTVTFFGGVRPCLTPIDHPANLAANRALARAFESEVLFTREGGSGPEADLADVLEAPVVFVGVGLPDDRIHSPNERVVFPLLLTAAEAVAYLWGELATALRA